MYLAEKTRELYKLPTPPDAILYNPVTVPPAGDNGARSAIRVVFAGTLTEKKGIVSLLAAWPRVLAGSPKAELHIWGKDGRTAGGGSMRAMLESSLPPAWSSTVHFHGHIALDDLLDQFQTARLAVLPSFAEGFALTPLHAMAAGCPTVYTTRGSGPELIEDGKTGLLVDPAKPDEISDAILRLLKDDGLADRLGRAGRRHIEDNFSLGTLIRQNVAFYEDCLRRFDARSASRAVAS
jgi:glycosyltransferase involved in cell wall biosynthesis